MGNNETHSGNSELLPGWTVVGIIVTALMSLCACSQTGIRLGITGPELFRAQRNPGENRIILDVAQQEHITGLGYQYAFLVLPLGKVVAPSADEDLYVKAYQKLRERGFSPLKTNSGEAVLNAELPALYLSVGRAAANGYDLLFIRRVVCSLEIDGSLSLEGRQPRTDSVSAQSAGYWKAAFKPQLETTCNKAMEAALDKLFERLLLGNRPHGP